MLGAIFGDLVGTPYEAQNMMGEIPPHKSTDFPLFLPGSRISDDTVMTVAVADALLHGKSYATAMQEWGRRYPNSGYGGSFFEWLHAEDPKPYGSWGNGSAMRVSPVGWAFPITSDIPEMLARARQSAVVTHNAPEGIYGAQAVTLAIFLARKGEPVEEIRTLLQSFYPEYELYRKVDEIRPDYLFDVSCQGSVPEAIICAFEASSVEEAVRLAVSLGGDADTQGCIAGAIAEARFGFPEELFPEVWARLPVDMQDIVREFAGRFMQLDLP